MARTRLGNSGAASLFLFSLVMVTNPAFAVSDLPEGKGRDLVRDTCTVCHSSAIITQQGMTREHWDETITWMQEKQGLWELEPNVRTKLLDYLSTYLGPKSKAGGEARSATDNKSVKRLHRYEYRPNILQ